MDITECQTVVVGEIMIDANEFLSPGSRGRDGLRDGGDRGPVRKYSIRRVGVRNERQKCRSNRSWHYFAAADLRASRTIRGFVGAEHREISAALEIRRNVLKNRGRVLLPPPFLRPEEEGLLLGGIIV